MSQRHNSGAESDLRIQLDHLYTLVDDVGIVQHAYGVVPNRASGYCVDDVARLVVVGVALINDKSRSAHVRLVNSGLSFLRHSWDRSAYGMWNFMGYDRTWIGAPHRGDHVGRSVWALGEVIAAKKHMEALGLVSRALLEEMGPALMKHTSVRETAFTALGLGRVPREVLPALFEEVLVVLASRLLTAYFATRCDDWQWFEDELTYDNARLPQALIVAGKHLGNDAMLAAGFEALDWYGGQCAIDSEVIQLVGNHWRRRGQSPQSAGEEGVEQPLDAAALVEAYVDAFAVTGDPIHRRRANNAFQWFTGRNHLGQSLYDSESGGCRDGLGPDSLNDNEGAESTLAYLQAYLALHRPGL